MIHCILKSCKFNISFLSYFFLTKADVKEATGDVLCSPKSTVIASIACIILIHLIVICGATVWCRRKFRQKQVKDVDASSSTSPPSPPPLQGQHCPVFYRASPSPSSEVSFRGIDFCQRYPNPFHNLPLSMHPSHWIAKSSESSTSTINLSHDKSEQI